MRQDWEIKKLIDVCELITCGVAARPKYVEEGIPFLSAKNVKDGKVVWSGYNCISEKTHKELTKNNKPKIGDILYTRVGSFGEAAVIEDNFEFSVFVSLTLIKVNHRILNNYFLKHYLNSNDVKMLARRSVSGSGVGNLNVGAVRQFPIPLPPLPEQLRIVGRLDEAFASIAKAKAIAEQNLKNARELFESYLQRVFDIKGKNWINSSIGETCNLFTGGTPSRNRKEYFEGGNIKWLVSGDINQKVIYDCEGRITEVGLKNSNARYLPVNSVLIALNGQGKTRGTVAMLKTLATCNQSLVAIYPKNDNALIPELIYANLEGRYNEIRKITGDSGNDRRGLNMPLIRKIKFSYPIEIEEQKKIIQRLDILQSETRKLEAIYQQRLNDLEELKKSILQKAFNGELAS